MKTYKFLTKIKYSILLLALCLVSAGCAKFTNVGAPTGQLVTANTFSNDNTLKSTIAGMYSTFAISHSSDLQLGLTFLPALSADEMQFYVSDPYYDQFILNSISSNNISSYSLWTSLYASIYQANSIIAGVQGSSGGLSDALKTEAIGEAKFVRAFCYFYLVNLWGDVPLALTTDASVNNSLARSSKSVVYTQIITDLNDAKNTLVSDYSYASGERIRPNKYAATALLARAYLYTGDWANAKTNADIVIGNSTVYSLLATANLGGIFVKNNTEAIWQVTGSPSIYSGYTYEGYYYTLGVATIPNYQLTSNLISAFESGDARFTNWVGTRVNTVSGVSTTYYYPYKYKQKATNATTSAEYCTYLRLGEQYLIRAEALAQQNNLSAALADINVIRIRAGLQAIAPTTQATVLTAIAQERRVELFSEYGARWNDLKRTNTATTVLSPIKTGWTANAALYPIPLTDIRNDVHLTQNPGY